MTRWYTIAVYKKTCLPWKWGGEYSIDKARYMSTKSFNEGNKPYTQSCLKQKQVYGIFCVDIIAEDDKTLFLTDSEVIKSKFLCVVMRVIDIKFGRKATD